MEHQENRFIPELETLFDFVKPDQDLQDVIMSYSPQDQAEMFDLFRIVMLDELTFVTAIYECKKQDEQDVPLQKRLLM